MPLPTYLMSNFPSVRPSLNLQFDSQPTPEDMTSHLASVGATFSRASIGTYTDANGLIQEASAGQARPNYSSAGVHEGLLIEESRTNLVTNSEGDFIGWNTAGGASFTPLSAIAPDGTVSAGTLVVPSSSARLENSSISVPDGEHTFSIYLKSSSGSFPIDIKIMGGTTVTVTDEWQRFTVTETVSSFNKLQIRAIASTGNQTLYVWGAQVEAGSFPTSYIPTIPTFSSRASTATFFNSSGVLSTASTNVARTDHKYIDGQWVEAGLLLEGASTNLHVNSGNLTGNNTATNEVSLSLETVTNPINGQTQVTKITDTAVSDTHFIQSSVITADGSSDYTFSILAKAGTLSTCRLLISGGGVGTVQMIVDLSDGSILSGSGTVEDVANGWYKLSVTGTSTTSTALASRVYTTDGTNVTYTGSSEYIYVAYRQLEIGSFPTSYIPTTASTATRSADVYTTATKTRSADVCYIDGTAFTDFYNQDAGTIFTQFESTASISDPFLFMISDGTGTNRIAIDINDGTEFRARITDGGSTNMNGTYSYSDAEYKLAFKFSTSGSVVIDGTERISDGSITLPTVDRIHLNSQVGSNVLTSTIKKFIYFPRALSDNELIKLTR